MNKNNRKLSLKLRLKLTYIFFNVLLISGILTAVIFYFLTLLITIPYNPQESNIFVDHLKGIGLSPYDLLKTIMERMNQNAL